MGAELAEREGVPLWMPTRYTPSLSGDETFPSDFDRWEPVFRHVWRVTFGIELAPFQVWILRHLMELYPAGHPRAGQLRWRTAFVSMGRQNSKSDLAAIVGLWGLLRTANGLTIGIASTADLANIVYKRALDAINANPSLKDRFARMTGTRGMETKTGALYQIKAAKTAALQGQAIHTGIVDEVHLIPEALWTDMVNGTGARLNTFVLGITTAGNDDSELLKRLYESAAESIAADPTDVRHGAFIWESPATTVPTSDADLLAALIPANPLLASGLVDADAFIADVRGLPPQGIMRYRLNRFVSGSEAFIDLNAWGACQRPTGESFPETGGPLIVCVDVTPDFSYGSIAVARKVGDLIHTKEVVWLNRPNIEQLTRVCVELAKRHRVHTFAMDSYGLRALGNELDRRGRPVTLLTKADAMNGSAVFYAHIVRQTLRHGGEPILSVQLPRTIRKAEGERFRISRKDSSVEIDAVMATVGAVYQAEITPDLPSVPIF